MKVATPYGIAKNGNLLVRSIGTKEECQKKGFQYEWEINIFSFLRSKEDTCEKLGIDEDEFNIWKIKMETNSY